MCEKIVSNFFYQFGVTYNAVISVIHVIFYNYPLVGKCIYIIIKILYIYWIIYIYVNGLYNAISENY